INDSDASEEALTEGRTLFTIGFPYGANIAQDSRRDLKNQVHGGSVTQNKGEYEFGHDAETAGGASGSPILNDKGCLIGVHHAGVTGSQGFNYAIKVKYLIDLIK
ncbi:MAG: serine protease, partial [Bacteroidaceae bacterium]|nr:serine protease [Bacteroidaceae bacterium]